MTEKYSMEKKELLREVDEYKSKIFNNDNHT